jgi:hypothetical protein
VAASEERIEEEREKYRQAIIIIKVKSGIKKSKTSGSQKKENIAWQKLGGKERKRTKDN